jgi:hypothetical protein
MRSASSRNHMAVINNATFSICNTVNASIMKCIQRTFVNPIGALFRPFGFGCFNLFIYLYIVLRRRTIYLCGVVQFHNANIEYSSKIT